MSIEWSPQQSGAIKSAIAWFKDKNGPQIHRIFGYAGTGKTTLAKEIASEIGGNVLYAAFTGKAASVMRRKGCDDASTIHSLIYRLKDDDDDTPTFELNRNSEVRTANLVILDECSMVGEELARDLLSFGTPVLVLGDPAQLPPIKGTGFFTEAEPDTMLTEVHRQARDNPIIRMSMDIREGGKFLTGEYGESRIITRAELQDSEVIDADQVLVGLNRTRSFYNMRMREILGRVGHEGMPVKDDKLVCLRNDRRLNVFNGTIWSVVNAKNDNKRPIVHMKLSSQDDESKRGVQVRREFFTGGEDKLQWGDKKGTQEFTYGYALTCHKAQGSQWDNVLIFDEGGSFREDAVRWRYTALTRSAQKVTVVI